jgi:hypothetical protein
MAYCKENFKAMVIQHLVSENPEFEMQETNIYVCGYQ